MADILLNLENVSVRFDALKAVDDVSLALKKGERRAVIGPNGAGKTTLFNAVTGVIIPTAGRITFEGRDITRASPDARAARGIGRTFQITNLFPSLSITDNMALALRALKPRKFSMFGGGRLDPEEKRRMEEVLTTARITPRPNKLVRELSYGEQRQLEMAMALVCRPRLLLLDEPAAGLSPAERSIVADIIRGLSRDTAIVLIEHDMDLALSLVDWVTCLHDGRLLAEGAPAEIPGNALIQDVYLGRRHA